MGVYEGEGVVRNTCALSRRLWQHLADENIKMKDPFHSHLCY